MCSSSLMIRNCSDSDSVDTMQEDLNRLVEWADKWQMEFNASSVKSCMWGKEIQGSHIAWTTLD